MQCKDFKDLNTRKVSINHLKIRTPEYNKFRNRGLEYLKLFCKKNNINEVNHLHNKFKLNPEIKNQIKVNDNQEIKI